MKAHTNKLIELASKQCLPCRGGDPVLKKEQVVELLAVLNHWQLNDTNTEISCRFEFKNFEETMKFINALAKIADEHDHHPDVNFGYNYCLVRYSTHAIHGLSENDFICAAKINLLQE